MESRVTLVSYVAAIICGGEESASDDTSLSDYLESVWQSLQFDMDCRTLEIA